MDYSKCSNKELRKFINERNMDDPGRKATKSELIELLKVRMNSLEINGM